MERCQLFRSGHIPANTGSTEAVRQCFYFCIVYDIYTPIELRVSTTRGTLLNHGSEFWCLRLENMRPWQHRFLGTAAEKLNITKIHNNQPIPCASHDDRNGAIFYAWFHPFFYTFGTFNSASLPDATRHITRSVRFNICSSINGERTSQSRVLGLGLALGFEMLYLDFLFPAPGPKQTCDFSVFFARMQRLNDTWDWGIVSSPLTIREEFSIQL